MDSGRVRFLKPTGDVLFRVRRTVRLFTQCKLRLVCRKAAEFSAQTVEVFRAVHGIGGGRCTDRCEVAGLVAPAGAPVLTAASLPLSLIFPP